MAAIKCSLRFVNLSVFKCGMHSGRFTLLALLSLLALGGCGGAQAPVALLAVEAASVMVFGRGVVDLGVSAVSGRDCSIVRLDRGQTYCAAAEESVAETFCTRSLGVPDCWASPALVPSARTGIGDTPAPSAAQVRYRAARWPKSLMAE